MNFDRTFSPIVLPDSISDQDFERFLDLLYPIVFGVYTAHTSEEWTSVLRVAHYLRFESLRALAIRTLYSIASPVEKIVCARDFGIDEWLEEAYADICLRPSPLCEEEGVLIGLSTCLKIAAAREAIRGTSALTDVTSAQSIIRRAFGLTIDHVDPAVPVDHSACISDQAPDACDDK
ncbi:hypothetical protein PUNSTDRAFT_105734 [Punctularia strigosozonata HHB-11173 SS5]|uniref:uncharacterized protein n=1 Tax=Punctularia strigosozonata (strain HHB-11173) TaxID=741275 RepID=UPI00044186C7|nr:uncharacterized protein PUNSTDRAFT_105734 [Punctularia strigosozonata HHB-11173 SS5]EIN06619.1 hypothetical protein PUNSTDRAFT_105734 [Punctularia strigosozonata HHB-11173 SS5]